MKWLKKIIFVFVVIYLSTATLNVEAQRGCCSHHGGVSGGCRNGKQVCNDGTTSPSCTCSGGSSNSYSYSPPKIYGCTDSTAYNYNPNANTNDGSCVAKKYGCTDPEAYNYDSSANTDNGACKAKVYGCTNKNAKNYNKDANISDNSCLFTKSKTRTEKVKYKTIKKYKLLSKEGKVLQKGVYGKKKIYYEEISDESGNIVETNVINEELVERPVNKIVATKKKSKKSMKKSNSKQNSNEKSKSSN